MNKHILRLMRRSGYVPVFITCAFLISGCGRQAPTNISSNTTVLNQNVSVTNTPTNQTVEGKVFVAGYSTPSESYGILAVDGREIGLGSYDSRKEEFRGLVGQSISVTFASICTAGSPTCCRSLLQYCGEVTSWK